MICQTSDAFYDTPYPNSPRTIELKAFPTVHSLHSPADLVVDNDTIEINNSYIFSSITVGQSGTINIKTGGNVIQLVTDKLIIDNNLNIDASGGGRVEIFINDEMKVTTKGMINNTDPGYLFIYLKNESIFIIQANMILNGYIIGPHATVEVQSAQSTVNGAIIANIVRKNEQDQGPNGAVNYVPLKYDKEFGDNIIEYNIIRWQK